MTLISGNQLRAIKAANGGRSIGDVFSRKASYINKHADGTIIIDPENIPSYRPFTLGRVGLAAPNSMIDSPTVTQDEYEEAMKGIIVQQKWAKDKDSTKHLHYSKSKHSSKICCSLLEYSVWSTQ